MPPCSRKSPRTRRRAAGPFRRPGRSDRRSWPRSRLAPRRARRPARLRRPAGPTPPLRRPQRRGRPPRRRRSRRKRPRRHRGQGWAPCRHSGPKRGDPPRSSSGMPPGVRAHRSSALRHRHRRPPPAPERGSLRLCIVPMRGRRAAAHAWRPGPSGGSTRDLPGVMHGRNVWTVRPRRDEGGPMSTTKPFRAKTEAGVTAGRARRPKARGAGPSRLGCGPGRAFYRGLGGASTPTSTSTGCGCSKFTPPGSGCSIQFGTDLTPAAPGSARGVYLVVDDIEGRTRRPDRRGVAVSGLP